MNSYMPGLTLDSAGNPYNPQPNQILSMGNDPNLQAQVELHNQDVTQALNNPGTLDFSGDQYGFRYVNLSTQQEPGTLQYLTTGLMLGGGGLAAEAGAAMRTVYSSLMLTQAATGTAQSASSAYSAFSSGNNVAGTLNLGLTALNLGGGYLNANIGLGQAAQRAVESTVSLPEGSFSVRNWTGYPANLPKPTGPMRLLETGSDQLISAQRAKAAINDELRQAFGLRSVNMDIHEIQPVKFGGSPTDLTNKILISRDLHQQVVTPFWNQLQQQIEPYVYRSSGG